MSEPRFSAAAPLASRKAVLFCPALCLAALALCLALVVPASAASRQELFDKALHSFKWVLEEESRAGRRDLWLKVHDRFDDLLRAGTDTGYAPKALYYMGRCYEELARRSGIRSDAVRSVDYFQRAANRFPPGDSWVDDCLYRKAELTFLRLGDGGTAARDLRGLLAQYPNGDQAGEAEALLARITGKRPQAAPARAAAPAPKPVAASVSKPKAPANATATYDRAVRDFRAIRNAKTPTRQQFVDVASRFRSVFHAVPRTTLGARAAYFTGFAYDELGQRSGSKDDFALAVEYYGRSVDLFDRQDSWRDDAIFRKADVTYRRLNNEDQAYADLLLLTSEYPGGDMAAAAKTLMREMDESRAEDLPAPEGPASPSAVASAPEAVGAGSFSSTSGAGVLTGIRYSSGDDFTRIVLDLTDGVAFSHARLPADPTQGKTSRMYIDLDQTTLAPKLDRKVDVHSGFLRAIRAGQNTPQNARVVLDFEDQQEYHILTLEDPYRIVIDVFASKTVAEDQKARRPERPATATAGAKRDENRKPGKTEAKTAQDVLAQLGMTIRTVMIDAGHGGRDPGALQYVRTKDSKGKIKKNIRTMEKDVALRAARILGKTLEKRGYQVLYTRSSDTKVQLEDRALAANIKKADLFISLHCNANNSSTVRGFETYYLGKARNDIVLRLAAKENHVDPVKISDTQKIVMDLVHSFKIGESKILAGHVQKKSVRQLKNQFKGIVDHGARSAPFFVLIGAKMPAVLVEIGYLTNSTEAELLRSDKYLQSVADGITAGIETYRQELQTAGL